ncbi:MAG: DUF2812 domain-containing protein [Eubacterium sp.]|nr:DUF2812 domain-containing protein [Eubacterium sp.]
MRKVVHKVFWAWEFDKEEKWLNEMAAKGLALVSVGFCRYEFEDCVPGEYKICLEFTEKKCGQAVNERYVEFLEETGAEHVGTYGRWVYFRKRTGGDRFELFSDNTSRIRHLTRIIWFIGILCMLNLCAGCYNLFLFLCGSSISSIGMINLLLSIFIGIGMMRLLRKRKKLKMEQQIYE